MCFAITSLTFSNATTVLQEGLEAIARGEHECDLGNLQQIDSASIAVLLAWQRAARKNNSPLAFRNIPESLISLASVYGVNDLLALS